MTTKGQNTNLVTIDITSIGEAKEYFKVLTKPGVFKTFVTQMDTRTPASILSGNRESITERAIHLYEIAMRMNYPILCREVKLKGRTWNKLFRNYRRGVLPEMPSIRACVLPGSHRIEFNALEDDKVYVLVHIPISGKWDRSAMSLRSIDEFEKGVV